MLLNVRRPRFEPATTGLSGKIHTHLTTAPSTWFGGSFCIYTNGDDRGKGYQIRAWFCWYPTIFQLYFSHKRWQWLGSAELRWTKPKVIPLSRYKLFTILLVTPTQINLISRGLPFHCMSSSAHVHTRIEQIVVFEIIFQDLIHWTEMFV